MKSRHFFAALFPLLGYNREVEFITSPLIHEHHIEQIFSIPDPMNGLFPPPHRITIKDNLVLKISQTKMINVPLINQNPELKYGCEVTSLAMVLNYAGVKVDKMELYKMVKKDHDPIKKSSRGDILHWGNPHDGFVGDMTGKNAGYAVFDQPIAQLMNEYLPDRAVNLTNQPFNHILHHVSKGYPVVVWTTGDYRLPDRWESWQHENHIIKTPLDLHAVVLVGYDQHFVYLNDPLSFKKKVKVHKQQFIKSWIALKSRAVSYE